MPDDDSVTGVLRSAPTRPDTACRKLPAVAVEFDADNTPNRQPAVEGASLTIAIDLYERGHKSSDVVFQADRRASLDPPAHAGQRPKSDSPIWRPILCMQFSRWRMRGKPIRQQLGNHFSPRRLRRSAFSERSFSARDLRRRWFSSSS